MSITDSSRAARAASNNARALLNGGCVPICRPTEIAELFMSVLAAVIPGRWSGTTARPGRNACDDDRRHGVSLPYSFGVGGALR
ncbi:hypothetical protein NIIDMKKI_51670 [Mycobacterium kansasii]|uniref:Uncharacterized protein n=1 Tax=Mycobacterium kansasii TaxID=1768 RepID=A0A7G1IG60_MYCKA|nr:hypothetical protein NIIDMKKI_51670 [Mycobacterium kansasii]